MTDKSPENRISEKGGPLVSVVVPVYNAGKTLEKCLDSIAAQTYANIELILVDDGSTDDTPGICAAFQERAPFRVRYVRQENSGPATARNRGIDESSGKYVGFADADDLTDPEMISCMLSAAEEHQAELVVSAYRLNDGKTIQEVCYTLPEGFYEGDGLRTPALSLLSEEPNCIPPYSWVRLIRKEALDREHLRFQDGLIRSEDYHFWAKVHFRIKSLCLLSRTPLYEYVENKDSVTHKYVPRYWEGVQTIYEDLCRTLPEDEEVKQKLDMMFVHRSLISLNNAARIRSLKKSRREIRNIVYNKALSKAIEEIAGIPDDRFQSYRSLMKNHGKLLVVWKYLLRSIRNRLTHR